jgi:hypothetical protein
MSEESNIKKAQPKQGLETGSTAKPSESNIKEAQPKSGLETKSVEGASGLSPKDKIAASYSDDLSGKNGATKQFDTFLELVNTEISAAMNGMTFSSGHGGAQIFGRNGQFAVAMANIVQRAIVPEETPNERAAIWDLEIVNAAAGTVKVNCGTIIRDVTSLTTQLTIAAAASNHTAVASQTLRLKITGAWTDPVCTLEAGAAWTGHPSAVQSSGSGATAAFEAYYYPLWEFVATAASDTVFINDNLHARKLVASTHLIRTAAGYHKTDDRPFAIPVLQPYHRALS